MGSAPSVCIPCGSALGATWNPALVETLGALVGREARDRGCRGLLAPTVNLHRSPLAGRNFECYSEDPLLSGRLAAGYVRGVQSQGVFATVKHFVGNDAEFERASISSVIDERSLRELYLVPFELAVTEGGALAIMTAYNRLNGRWLTQRADFLLDILRDEWGFQGLVMTDWFAVTDTKMSLGAGLDLEMPGPARSLGATRGRRRQERATSMKRTSTLPSGGCSAGSTGSERWTDRHPHRTSRPRRPASWHCSAALLPRRRSCSRTTASSRSRPRPAASRWWALPP